MRCLKLFIPILASTLFLPGASAQTARENLKALVEINSGTANTGGVDRVQAWIAGELKKLGFEVETGADRVLVGTLKGTDPRTITFLVHADTVFEPASAFKKFEFRPDGLTASGPGVIDDKGGVVVALSGLKKYLAASKNKFTLRFVSTPAEESGSPGLDDRFKNFSEDTWILLGFEPGLDDGSVVNQRRGNRWYKITSLGKEAHAGRAHKDGRNACVDLAAKLAKISTFTDYARNVTVSVGHMTGGQDKFNIVCGSAEAKVDTRFASVKERDRLHQKITAVLKEKVVDGVTTTFEIANDSTPFSANKKSEPLIAKYLEAIQSVEGRAVKATLSGGAGDTNGFSRPGLVILDGLGPYGGKMHTEGEFITLSSLETRAEALSRFLVHVLLKY